MSSREPASTIVMVPISEQIDNPDAPPTIDVKSPAELELTRDTIFKLASTGLSFFFSGMNDGSLGALIPYLLRSYNISTDLVSIV